MARRRARRRLLMLTALVALALAPAAHAALAAVSQTPDITDTRYSSVLVSVHPQLAGVKWYVIDRNDELELVNHSRQTVTVYGYSGARSLKNVSYAGGPYARIEPDGTVQVNTNSQAYYLNQSFFANYANVPSTVAASGLPADWLTLAKTGEYIWHDHRIHYTSPSTPPVVTDTHRRTLIFDWYIPFTAGTSDGYLFGQLYWNAEKSFSFPIGAIIAFVVVVIAGAALVIVVRRRRAPSAPGEDW